MGDAITSAGNGRAAALAARFVSDDQGADLIEYALLVGLIALAMTTALTNLSTSIGDLFTRIQTKLGAINP